MTESPRHGWESDEYLSRKTVQRGQVTQWEVCCLIHEKLRFVADQNRPSPGNRLEVVTFPLLQSNLTLPLQESIPLVDYFNSHVSVLMLIIP